MFGKRKRAEMQEMSLNITSLMDILTIVLIFLIQSFSTQEHEVPPPADFLLPNSSAEIPIKLAVKVTISEKDVRVEDKVVVGLPGGKYRSRDLNRANHVADLLNELERQKARIASGGTTTKPGEEDESEIVYLEAARGTPFDTVDKTLKTAAAAGFTKFRLAVNRR